jgi:hypothetical protein
MTGTSAALAPGHETEMVRASPPLGEVQETAAMTVVAIQRPRPDFFFIVYMVKIH